MRSACSLHSSPVAENVHFVTSLTFFSFRMQLFKFSSKCQVVTGKIGNLSKFRQLITAERRFRSHLVFHNNMWQRRSSARSPIFIHPCISEEGRHGRGRCHQLILGPSVTLTAGGNSEDSLGVNLVCFSPLFDPNSRKTDSPPHLVLHKVSSW